MYETADDYAIATSMSKYLMSQGERIFGEDGSKPSSAPDESGDWTQRIEATTGLGWDCLLEGKLSTQWISFARAGLKRTGNPMSPEGWTSCFIDKLIRITHQQWIYRNYKVPF